jgi:uncharacterized membrane protein YfcA
LLHAKRAMIYAEPEAAGACCRQRKEIRGMIGLALLVGVTVGVISGIVGIGGGVLFIPALIWLFGMDQHKAQGTSLGALLAPVGIFAFYEYYRKGNADLRIALLLAAGFLVGGYFGAVAAQHVPELWLRRIFAGMLLVIGARMFFSR